MALNMGKRDLRGLSPGPASLAGKPRPFLSRPRKPGPASCPTAPAAAWYPCGGWVPAETRHRASESVRPRANAQRRVAFVPREQLRDGGSEEPQPRRMHRGFRLDLGRSGAFCARSEFFELRHHPAHSKDSRGKALGPKNREVSPPPAEAQSGVGTGFRFLAAWPEAGAGSAAAAVRTTTQTFFRPLFSSKLGIHGDWARQPDSPTA